MVFTKVYAAPIILGIWFPMTFTITYIVAVCTQHVRPILPYISDTGTWAPESCIFGIMLTLGGFLTIIIVYVRYRQVRDILEKFDFTPRTQKVNELTAYVGAIAAFGCIIVADFQVTNVFSVHILGAFLCFGLANVYQVIQVIFSFKLYPKLGNRRVNIFRAVCVSLCAVSFSVCSVTGLISLSYFSGDDITKWRKQDGGYDFHVASAACEYLMSFFVVIFFVTFTGEFRYIHFEEPEMTTS